MSSWKGILLTQDQKPKLSQTYVLIYMWPFLRWRHEIKTVMKSNGPELEHFFDTSNIVLERLAESALNPGPLSWIFAYVSVCPNPRSSLFTSATVRIPVLNSLKCDTNPIRYVKPHFRDQRGAANHSVTDIAPKSLFLCVNRIPIL